MTRSDPAPAIRDAARSREAILEAAEQLFARQGYEAASLEEIGRLAGVSRGTPRYFFGAKQDLYRAVLARVLSAEAAVLVEIQRQVTEAGGGPDEMVAGLVEGFIDFLVARPTFVRLVEREAAGGGALLREVAAECPDVQTGLAKLGATFAAPSFRDADPAQILLSLLALCWFPLGHADTFTRAMGMDPGSQAFLDQWKRHVVRLVLRGLRSDP